MTTDPYAPPIASAEPSPNKRPFIRSGSRILLVAFVAARVVPFLGSLLIGYLAIGFDPSPNVNAYVFQRGDMAIEVIVSAIMSVASIGTWMLAHEPRNRVDKAPAWLRWAAIGSSSVYAIALWVDQVFSFLASPELAPDGWAIANLFAVISRHVAILMLVVLVRHVASSLGEKRTRRLADVNFVLRGVAFVWFVLIDPAGRYGNSSGMFISAAVHLMGDCMLFAMLWSSRRFESVS